MTNGRRFRIGLLCLLFFLIPAGCAGQKDRDYPFGDRLRNASGVVRSIRHGLKGRASEITVRFDYGDQVFEELNEAVAGWMDLALEETDDPAEGDYIRYQYGGYTYNSSYTDEDGRHFYTVRIIPRYYGYLAQEEQVDERIAELRRSFGFLPWTGDEEKIRVIYTWLTQHVAYDKVHAKNPYDHRGSTAYAALVNGTATCQGYATALYRLLREEGISCRIVTGEAAGDRLHAWVIAELDGKYYQLDPTFDAGEEEFRCFLKGTEDFPDHLPGEAFRNESFLEQYPQAQREYAGES